MANDLYTATTGRHRYLEQQSLAIPDPKWWQASGRIDGVVGGLDFLSTTTAFQLIDVPASFLGDGMEGFREMVEFVGAPLSRDIGDADTVMERLGSFTVGEPVRTRLVAFGNVTSEPVELVGGGTLAGRYEVVVTLSPTADSYGEMTLVSHDGGESGTFNSTVSLTPLFELRPLAGGDSIFVDTARVELPGFPMELASSGGHWSRRPPSDDAVRHDQGDGSLFYPGRVSIVTQRVSVSGNVVDITAGCDKAQATFGNSRSGSG